MQRNPPSAEALWLALIVFIAWLRATPTSVKCGHQPQKENTPERYTEYKRQNVKHCSLPRRGKIPFQPYGRQNAGDHDQQI
jgi:hypothetical protein